MATDPRSALNSLVTSLERHLEACVSRQGEEDERVIAAYNDLADAFEDYDEALLDAYGEVTPLEVYSEDDSDNEESGDSLENSDGSDEEIEDFEDPEEFEPASRYTGAGEQDDFEEDLEDDWEERRSAREEEE